MGLYKGGGYILQTSYHKHYHSKEHSGICVVRHQNESDEDLLKRFRKKFSKSGISKELRERMFYEKPSKKRRRKKLQSIRAIKRDKEKLKLLEEKVERSKNKKFKMKGNKDDQSNRRQTCNNFNEKN